MNPHTSNLLRDFNYVKSVAQVNIEENFKKITFNSVYLICLLMCHLLWRENVNLYTHV